MKKLSFIALFSALIVSPPLLAEGGKVTLQAVHNAGKKLTAPQLEAFNQRHQGDAMTFRAVVFKAEKAHDDKMDVYLKTSSGDVIEATTDYATGLSLDKDSSYLVRGVFSSAIDVDPTRHQVLHEVVAFLVDGQRTCLLIGVDGAAFSGKAEEGAVSKLKRGANGLLTAGKAWWANK